MSHVRILVIKHCRQRPPPHTRLLVASQPDPELTSFKHMKHTHAPRPNYGYKRLAWSSPLISSHPFLKICCMHLLHCQRVQANGKWARALAALPRPLGQCNSSHHASTYTRAGEWGRNTRTHTPSCAFLTHSIHTLSVNPPRKESLPTSGFGAAPRSRGLGFPSGWPPEAVMIARRGLCTRRRRH